MAKTAKRGGRRRRLTRIDAIVREVLAEMRARMQIEEAAEYSTPPRGRTADGTVPPSPPLPGRARSPAGG